MKYVAITILLLLANVSFAPDKKEDPCPEALEGVLGRIPEATSAAEEGMREKLIAEGMKPEEAAAAAKAMAEIMGLVTRVTVEGMLPKTDAVPVANTPKNDSSPRQAQATNPLDQPRGEVPVTFEGKPDYKSIDPFATPLVPWLAVRGPHAYTPENPPRIGKDMTWADYSDAVGVTMGQGGFCLPFGCAGSGIGFIKDFWENVKSGRFQKIAVHQGRLEQDGTFHAPVAIYKDTGNRRYILIQNGNYHFLSFESQPKLEKEGKLILYRGIGTSTSHPVETFRGSNPAHRRARLYQGLLNWYIHSRSDLAFGYPYSGTARSETNHIDTNISALVKFREFAKRWLSDEEIKEAEKYISVMPRHHSNRFSFHSNIPQFRFGPNILAVETPVTNIRFTSDFNSEGEAQLIDRTNFTHRPDLSENVTPSYSPARPR